MVNKNVTCGVDELIATNFEAVKGFRIGLITNHTGLTIDQKTTIDVLHSSNQVKLITLFGPEHGIRGTQDEKISDSIDVATGLAVHSLYGSTQRPLPQDLVGLDALVYDIQDIGCRFYTYIATLGNAMEEAAKAKIKFIVLDRPNPVNGVDVAGPISDSSHHEFTAWHPIPVRHGMTVGELAKLFNSERKIGCDLHVVPCGGWRRNMFWDETGLLWTNPSPNMRNLTEALLYPGIGLLETTNLSVGRGTDTPFEVVGAPWIDASKLGAALNAQMLPGVRFVPIKFTPKSSVYHGEICSGVNLIISSRSVFQPLLTGMTFATVLQEIYPRTWQVEKFNSLLANRSIFTQIKEGTKAKELEYSWGPALNRFVQNRKQYLIYR